MKKLQNIRLDNFDKQIFDLLEQFKQQTIDILKALQNELDPKIEIWGLKRIIDENDEEYFESFFDFVKKEIDDFHVSYSSTLITGENWHRSLSHVFIRINSDSKTDIFFKKNYLDGRGWVNARKEDLVGGLKKSWGNITSTELPWAKELIEKYLLGHLEEDMRKLQEYENLQEEKRKRASNSIPLYSPYDR